MNSKKDTSSRYRFTAVIIGAILALYLVLLSMGLSQRREAERIATAASHLSSTALGGWTYAEEHDGAWPNLAARGLAFAYADTDLPRSFVIGDPPQIPVQSPSWGFAYIPLNGDTIFTLQPALEPADYYYLGYAVASEEEGMALAQAVARETPLYPRISVEPGKGTMGSSTLYRLHRDLAVQLHEDGVIKDEDPGLARRIPVLIERPAGSEVWVVFLDFHVERLSFPGPFPLSERFIDALESTRVGTPESMKS